MAKQFDLKKFKANMTVAEIPYKKDSYINFNPALQAVTGLPGLAQGHVTQIYGPSNGGKTSLALHLAAQAQKDGILPIFIITEDKLSLPRAEAMGVNMENAILVEATYVEDIFKHIGNFMAAQADGSLPMDLLFIVDSIGNTVSESSITVTKEGVSEVGGAMMKVARVLRENMRVYSHKINNTRKENSPKFASLIFINHSYQKPPSFPGAPTTDVAYGGDGIYYSSSLVIKVKKSKQLKAIKDGMDITFGIVSKIAVEKNHLSGVSNQGDFVIVANDIIPNDPNAIKAYKAANSANWGTFTTDDGEELE
jgi:recombination protein RecA